MTRAGEALLVHARRVLSALAEAEAGAGGRAAGGLGPHRGAGGVRRRPVPAVLARFAATHLGIEILLSCWWRGWALKALDDRGRAWRVACTSRSVAGIQAAVAAGLALAVLRRLLAGPPTRRSARSAVPAGGRPAGPRCGPRRPRPA